MFLMEIFSLLHEFNDGHLPIRFLVLRCLESVHLCASTTLAFSFLFFSASSRAETVSSQYQKPL